MIEVWTVTHNTHPSGQIETIVFPDEQKAWICWVQLVGVAWNKWFGEDARLYPGGDAAALIIETIPNFPYQVQKREHLVHIAPKPDQWTEAEMAALKAAAALPLKFNTIITLTPEGETNA